MNAGRKGSEGVKSTLTVAWQQAVVGGEQVWSGHQVKGDDVLQAACRVDNRRSGWGTESRARRQLDAKGVLKEIGSP